MPRLSPKRFSTEFQVEGNSDGLQAYRGANVIVRDSVAAGNAQHGFSATISDGLPTRLTIVRSAALNNNSTGVFVIGPAARVVITESTFAGNSSNLAAGSGAVIASFGNNRLVGGGAPDSTIAPR
jgi:hypothetical protein